MGIDLVIGDKAAAAFSGLLYRAIGEGYPAGRAVTIATAALQMHGVPDHDTVRLEHAPHVDPAHLFVIPAHLMPSGPHDTYKPRADTTLPLVRKTMTVVVTIGGTDGINDGAVEGTLSENGLRGLGTVCRYRTPAPPGRTIHGWSLVVGSRLWVRASPRTARWR